MEEGEAKRLAYGPQLLISLWVYAYSEGVSPARGMARRCEYLEQAREHMRRMGYALLAALAAAFGETLALTRA